MTSILVIDREHFFRCPRSFNRCSGTGKDWCPFPKIVLKVLRTLFCIKYKAITQDRLFDPPGIENHSKLRIRTTTDDIEEGKEDKMIIQFRVGSYNRHAKQT